MRSAIAMAFLAAATPALAQTAPPPAAASPLSALYACQGRPDAERLACFDAAVAALQAKEAAREVVAVDRETVRAIRREAFGFNLPSLPRLGLPGFRRGDAGPVAEAERAAEEELNEVRLTVERLGADPGGRPLLRMTNGQVWLLTDSVGFQPRRPPFGVRIEEASLGSFILQVEGRNRGFRARRVE